MTDFLDEKRDEIAARLSELKPALNEYRRLEAAAAALDGIPAAANGDSAASQPAGRRRPGRPRGSDRKPGRPKGSGRKATTETPAIATATTAPARRGRPLGRRKGSGGRAAHALSIVQKQPGIAIPELAERMGIKQHYLYHVICPSF